METFDAEKISSNCEIYVNSDSKAMDVLRKANGRRSYKEIAKIVGLHQTTTSSLLKKSLKLGLSTKNKEGFYHKKPGILGYMPKTKNKNNSSVSMEKRIEGISKRALKASKISNNLLDKYRVQHTDKMAEAYVWLYTTENTLRELIRRVLGDTDSWWNSVNPDIKKKVKESLDNYPYDGANRKDELEYTHLGQLKEIIISKSNWDKFKIHLNEPSKDKFQLKIDNAISSRNSIGHCIPLNSEDRNDVVVRFKDILKMIK
jgi:DNA-binding Lrp family transcriptional regulator